MTAEGAAEPPRPGDWVGLPLIFRGLRRRSPGAIPVLIAGTAIAAVLIALQGTISPAPGFLALLAAGFVLGSVCGGLRDAVLTGFLSGYVAFAVGTAAVGAWIAISEAASFEAIGAFVAALVFGVIAGIWSAGAAALAGAVRRRPHVAHLL